MENENSEQEQQVDMAKQSLYIKELLKEKMQLDPEHHANAMRLVDEGTVVLISSSNVYALLLSPVFFSFESILISQEFYRSIFHPLHVSTPRNDPAMCIAYAMLFAASPLITSKYASSIHFSICDS